MMKSGLSFSSRLKSDMGISQLRSGPIKVVGAAIGETKWNEGPRMNLSNTCRTFADLQQAAPLRLRKATRLFGSSALPLAS